MSIDPSLVALGIGALTFIGTIFTAIANRDNEHRITKLEEGAWTKDEKEKFMKVCFQVEMMWKFYEAAPALLKNPPEMDDLLDEVAGKGVDWVVNCLPKEKLDKLMAFLADQRESPEAGRRLIASMYLHMLNSRLARSDGDEHDCT